MNSTNTSRTAHLLALMKKGDDAFNSRDVAGTVSYTHLDVYKRQKAERRRERSDDREAAGASARLPGRFWLAAKLFTRLRLSLIHICGRSWMNTTRRGSSG